MLIGFKASWWNKSCVIIFHICMFQISIDYSFPPSLFSLSRKVFWKQSLYLWGSGGVLCTLYPPQPALCRTTLGTLVLTGKQGFHKKKSQFVCNRAGQARRGQWYFSQGRRACSTYARARDDRAVHETVTVPKVGIVTVELLDCDCAITSKY